jgi:hypothetical protein
MHPYIVRKQFRKLNVDVNENKLQHTRSKTVGVFELINQA